MNARERNPTCKRVHPGTSLSELTNLVAADAEDLVDIDLDALPGVGVVAVGVVDAVKVVVGEGVLAGDLDLGVQKVVELRAMSGRWINA